LQELQPLGIASSVHQISIDTTPRGRIPSTVTSVPTLIMVGQNDPLVGDHAFGWLNAQKQQQQAHQQHAYQQQAHPQQASAQTQPARAPNSLQQGGGPSANVGGGGGGGEPSAWQCVEMGPTFSDTYSFLDNSYTELGTGAQNASNGSGGGSTIPKNFAYITPPEWDVKQPAITQTHQPRQEPGIAYAPPQQQSHQQPHQQSQHPRMSMPSGYGSYPPNAAMAPPVQNGGGGGGGGPVTDQLTQQMEALQMTRDTEAPPGMGRV